MVVSKSSEDRVCNIMIRGEVVRQVDKFVYLGSQINADARCVGEIKRSIALAKRAFTRMRRLLVNTHISLECQKRMVKTYIWSELLYGCETWTLNCDTRRRLEAVEMFVWRRVLKIP